MNLSKLVPGSVASFPKITPVTIVRMATFLNFALVETGLMVLPEILMQEFL